MWDLSTCGGPNEIKENTHAANVAAPFAGPLVFPRSKGAEFGRVVVAVMANWHVDKLLPAVVQLLLVGARYPVRALDLLEVCSAEHGRHDLPPGRMQDGARLADLDVHVELVPGRPAGRPSQLAKDRGPVHPQRVQHGRRHACPVQERGDEVDVADGCCYDLPWLDLRRPPQGHGYVRPFVDRPLAPALVVWHVHDQRVFLGAHRLDLVQDGPNRII